MREKTGFASQQLMATAQKADQSIRYDSCLSHSQSSGAPGNEVMTLIHGRADIHSIPLLLTISVEQICV